VRRYRKRAAVQRSEARIMVVYYRLYWTCAEIAYANYEAFCPSTLFNWI
jgi:hypothetical protein